MTVTTEEGRQIGSVEEELELLGQSIPAKLPQWLERLEQDKGSLAEIEREVAEQMQQCADHVVAGLLAEVGATSPSQEQVDDFRRECSDSGNPLRTPTKNYPLRVTLLGGLILCLRVLYCPPLKLSGQPEQPQIESAQEPEISGVHIELSQFGFGKGCSPALEEEVARVVVFFPSMELARKELARRGIELDIKQIKRISEQAGMGLLRLRLDRLEQWKSGALEPGNELKGKRVVVAIDGGRVRFRQNRKPTKKGKRPRFDAVWREPKMVVIYTLDKEGRKDSNSAYWIDGTFQGPDHMGELIAMHLYRLGASKAKTVEFVSDGAPWIWNRIDWIVERVGIHRQKVVKVLDFWHAAHHISIALDHIGFEAQERRRIYKELRRKLKNGGWRAVVQELEALALAQELSSDNEAYKRIAFLRRHGELGHLQYLKCKRSRITRGSGAIESTIRRVINLRLKGNGTFWLEENAEAIMVLRASLLSEQWESEVKQLRELRKRPIAKRSYKWQAQNILHQVKPAFSEDSKTINTSKSSSNYDIGLCS